MLLPISVDLYITYPRQCTTTFKTFYGASKKLWVYVDVETADVEEWVPPPLDIYNLELQSSFFKIDMILNAQVAVSLPMIENPMSCLWHKLPSNHTKLSIVSQWEEFLSFPSISRGI